MPSVIPFRKPAATEPLNYGAAWRDGCAFGERCANQRYLWIGIAMGCVLSTVIALVVLHYMGATK